MEWGLSGWIAPSSEVFTDTTPDASLTVKFRDVE
jgi:hypothetical protein